MGYRTYIGKLPAEQYNKIKDLSYDELINFYHGEYTEAESEIGEDGIKRTKVYHFRKIRQGDEMGCQKGYTTKDGQIATEFVDHIYDPHRKRKSDNRYVGHREILEEIYEFGKYVEFGDKKFYNNFFSNEETNNQFTGEYDFWLVEKEFLAHIIEHYKQKIITYYNEMLNPFFGKDMDTNPFLDSVKSAYKEKSIDRNYTFDFSLITQDQQNQLFEILHHMRSMRNEWTLLQPFNLEKGEQVTNSWKYEYNIFELVRIYKTFDWDNDVLVYYGY